MAACDKSPRAVEQGESQEEENASICMSVGSTCVPLGSNNSAHEFTSITVTSTAKPVAATQPVVQPPKTGCVTRTLGGVLDLLTAPCSLAGFVHSLYTEFQGYVPMVLIQYAGNQGFGSHVGRFAMRYYMMDVVGLDGATIGRMSAVTKLPWMVKPCFGLLSDAVPLFGFHRSPYLVLGSVVGLIGYLVLGLVPLTAVLAVIMFVLVQINVASGDVILDAATAERSKQVPTRASDLQSLCHGASALAGLVASMCQGYLEKTVGPGVMFLVLAAIPLGTLVTALRRWLPEQRLPAGQHWKINKMVFCEYKGVTMLAAYMSVSAVMLSLLQLLVDDPRVRGVFTLVSSMTLAVAVFMVLRKVSPVLAKVALFVLVRQCMQVGIGEPMFVWMSKAPEGPQLGPVMLSYVDCFGSLGLLVSVTVYNRYLTRVSYRKIFLFSQLAIAAVSMFDFILVKRWNQLIGIPDFLFVVGDDALSHATNKFFSIPMFVLASKVCPDNLEATMFAMLMSLGNFGHAASDFAGVSLCEGLGVVHRDFERLPEAIIAKSLCRLLPIPLIFVLIPNLSPKDSLPAGTADKEGNNEKNASEENAVSDI